MIDRRVGDHREVVRLLVEFIFREPGSLVLNGEPGSRKRLLEPLCHRKCRR